MFAGWDPHALALACTRVCPVGICIIWPLHILALAGCMIHFIHATCSPVWDLYDLHDLHDLHMFAEWDLCDANK